ELLIGQSHARTVEITLPLGEKVRFKLLTKRRQDGGIYASVIKDAGDDPDVTNKAVIGALVKISSRKKGMKITGGKGVGQVTKPGLPVKPGNSAINPVPMRMIRASVNEAIMDARTRGLENNHALDVTIIVPKGEALAKKTLNKRLGIIGGISILGTTGIVRPLSTEAWTSTIASSMDVAEAVGLDEIVLSTGRTSELAHMKQSGLVEEAYVMMGDHVAHSLKEAGTRSFKKVTLAAQWAKMLKIAMGTPDTHVRAGAFSVKRAVPFLESLGVKLPKKDYNTAREIYDNLKDKAQVSKVCAKAGEYATSVSGIKVRVQLIDYDGEVLDA
ncbi:cobalt-precorrin-5B (C(1))-methyltransferase CbiD, partial [Nitrospirota bacterium]